MTAIRSLVGIVGRGLVVGALLGLAVPASSVNARDEEGCKCDDNGTGKYECNYEQTECRGGTQTCSVVCVDPT